MVNHESHGDRSAVRLRRPDDGLRDGRGCSRLYRSVFPSFLP